VEPSCVQAETIQAFAERRLRPEVVAGLDAHTRTCSPCRQLVTVALGASTPRSQPGGPPPRPVVPGSSIGRYIVLGHQGSGGMGDVYAAYDPQLDRKIALKLLRAEGEASDERGRSRLLREAKAIAKLSHPNVVVVFDAGTHDDRVFVGMEFVDGQTLAAWLADRPRTRREILAAFTEAGRGLGAAHAAGLVHRDFKPQNVMVGADGKVRVMDFGLARSIGDDGQADGLGDGRPPPGEGRAADVLAALGEAPLTRTGELLGTPLFMAPEQFVGERADARTDQFSFCVALYAALFGAHPFPTETLSTLMTAVLRGEVTPTPAKATVPSWLRRVVLRGLAADPSQRWPSMEALVDAMAHDPARSRRRLVVAGAVAAVVALAGVGLWRAGHAADDGPALCQRGADRLSGLWEPSGSGPVHDRVRTSFAATGLSYAPETWSRTAAMLDRYATRWLGAHRDACEARHVRAEQSADTFELRMTCLDERLTGLRALVDVLAAADRDTVARAVDAASALPTLDRCADVKLLREPVEPPRDAPTRARVEAIREQTAVVEALHLTGKHRQALDLGRKSIEEARATQYRPLIAEVLVRTWAFQEATAFPEETAAGLQEGIWTALASRRDDIAARGAALLSGVEGYTLARHEDGERWAALGDAILDRLGPGHDDVRAWLFQTRSAMAVQAGDLDAGLRHAQEALALKERVLPPGSPDLAESLLAMAEALFVRGELPAALAMNQRSREIYIGAYGEGSPWLAKVLSNRGEYLIAAGQAAEAIPLFLDALGRWEPQLGADHPYLAYPLTGLGVASSKLGRFAEAVPPLERALRIREAREPNQLQVADTRLALARALWDSGGDRVRAVRLAETAGEFYDGEESSPPRAAEARAWLSAHRPTRVAAVPRPTDGGPRSRRR